MILRWNKKFDIAQKVIWFRQKRVDLARKSISCQRKKVDVAQKSISCRQKQDDAASKKYFVRKKVINFFPERPLYVLLIKSLFYLSWNCFITLCYKLQEVISWESSHLSMFLQCCMQVRMERNSYQRIF